MPEVIQTRGACVESVHPVSAVAVRDGAVYDLTGDAKTAIRVGFNRYNVTYSNNATAPYDPLVIRSDTRNWSDCRPRYRPSCHTDPNPPEGC